MNLREYHMNRLIIIGAGGHGKVIADIASKIGYSEIAFLDDNAVGECMGLPIIGKSHDIDSLNDGRTDFVIGIGNNNYKFTAEIFTANEIGRNLCDVFKIDKESIYWFYSVISQNNNIPRIRKIVREISAEYGVNLSIQNDYNSCPLSLIEGKPNENICKACGRCYTFPSASDILDRPEGLLPSKPGFRYGYILDAAEKIASGEVDIAKIKSENSYEYTLETLKTIKGIGDKVASCAALFGFGNLEAFPIDVWMKRAIDTYFGGKLDHTALGPYAGIAQQYIFHYIRNGNKE